MCKSKTKIIIRDFQQTFFWERSLPLRFFLLDTKIRIKVVNQYNKDRLNFIKSNIRLIFDLIKKDQ